MLKRNITCNTASESDWKCPSSLASKSAHRQHRVSAQRWRKPLLASMEYCICFPKSAKIK